MRFRYAIGCCGQFKKKRIKKENPNSIRVWVFLLCNLIESYSSDLNLVPIFQQTFHSDEARISVKQGKCLGDSSFVRMKN